MCVGEIIRLFSVSSLSLLLTLPVRLGKRVSSAAGLQLLLLMPLLPIAAATATLLVHMILLQLLHKFCELILRGQGAGVVRSTGTATHLVRITRTARATSTRTNTNAYPNRRLVRVHVVVQFTAGTGRRRRM